jgi:hypothetical protein
MMILQPLFSKLGFFFQSHSQDSFIISLLSLNFSLVLLLFINLLLNRQGRFSLNLFEKEKNQKISQNLNELNSKPVLCGQSSVRTCFPQEVPYSSVVRNPEFQTKCSKRRLRPLNSSQPCHQSTLKGRLCPLV